MNANDNYNTRGLDPNSGPFITGTGPVPLGAAFVPDGNVEHSADMTRLFRNFDVARDAEYIARVAAGQDPLNPSKDKRRDKRPRCVEELFKRLCWLNMPNQVMEKNQQAGLFGATGERWITRREIEHQGGKRAWGGKFSEDQVDTALAVLEKAGIIERHKYYNPRNKTSRISIRLCPVAILDILAWRKESKTLVKEKPSRKRVAPAIAGELIFLKPHITWQEAIGIGEMTRAAACELDYEPTLRKYLLPMTACIKGLPRYVPNRADRRTVVEDAALVEFLKMLLKKWRVNPEDHQFRHQPLAFTLDSWRALSHDELKAAGFSEAQIVRCQGLLVASGFLEWVNLRSPGKGEPRIYARLRVDLMLKWIREFKRSNQFLGLPRGAKVGWIPSVIHPRSINNLIYNNGSETMTTLGSRKTIKDKLYPAVAGGDFSSLLEHAQDTRRSFLKSPLDSGDESFRLITSLFSEIFFPFFANPETPFTHKIASQLRSLVNRGAMNHRMSLKDLQMWQYARENFNPGHSEYAWIIHQNPENPEKMAEMLKHWSSIKRLLYEDSTRYMDLEARIPLEDWNNRTLANWSADIDTAKNLIRRAIEIGKTKYPHLYGNRGSARQNTLGYLVALHVFDLQDDLAEFIANDRDVIKQAVEAEPLFGLTILKEHPGLMNKVGLAPEFWGKVRQNLQNTFRKVQVRQAQARLDDNEVDDLNSPWRIDPDVG